ncbi:MAG: YbjQ family protein, partial [Gammaproteobacteria bacterium]|nr:YbjQ family protein [Gammaproteobacteria bacterium]
ARREAVLRMVESARQQGYDAVINVRLETSRLANSARDGKGTAGVEMLAFGTALKFKG